MPRPLSVTVRNRRTKARPRSTSHGRRRPRPSSYRSPRRKGDASPFRPCRRYTYPDGGERARGLRALRCHLRYSRAVRQAFVRATILSVISLSNSAKRSVCDRPICSPQSCRGDQRAIGTRSGVTHDSGAAEANLEDVLIAEPGRAPPCAIGFVANGNSRSASNRDVIDQSRLAEPGGGKNAKRTAGRRSGGERFGIANLDVVDLREAGRCELCVAWDVAMATGVPAATSPRPRILPRRALAQSRARLRKDRRCARTAPDRPSRASLALRPASAAY